MLSFPVLHPLPTHPFCLPDGSTGRSFPTASRQVSLFRNHFINSKTLIPLPQPLQNQYLQTAPQWHANKHFHIPSFDTLAHSFLEGLCFDTLTNCPGVGGSIACLVHPESRREPIRRVSLITSLSSFCFPFLCALSVSAFPPRPSTPHPNCPLRPPSPMRENGLPEAFPSTPP
jgi:hypothetical protein